MDPCNTIPDPLPVALPLKFAVTVTGPEVRKIAVIATTPLSPAANATLAGMVAEESVVEIFTVPTKLVTTPPLELRAVILRLTGTPTKTCCPGFARSTAKLKTVLDATVKLVAVLTVPPGVVIVIGPVGAPTGTVAVI